MVVPRTKVESESVEQNNNNECDSEIKGNEIIHGFLFESEGLEQTRYSQYATKQTSNMLSEKSLMQDSALL